MKQFPLIRINKVTRQQGRRVRGGGEVGEKGLGLTKWGKKLKLLLIYGLAVC